MADKPEKKNPFSDGVLVLKCSTALSFLTNFPLILSCGSAMELNSLSASQVF